MNSKIEKNFPLADETTFKIGGPAELFVPVDSKTELEEVVKEAQKKEIPLTVLGGGSNVLISEEGIKGLTVKLRSGEIETLKPGIFRVGAGASLHRLSDFSLQKSRTGMEWAAGIPGTMGGAVYGNAGAFGRCVADNLKEVEVLKDQKKKILKRDEINFSYRNSTFKRENLVILSATIRLEKDSPAKIRERIELNLNHRKKNHPVDAASAGSIFKNPETSIEDNEIVSRYPMMKKFNENRVIPAGYLVEKVGMKGSRIGGAEVSEKHANFIINKDGADADDVKNLIQLIKKKVKKEFGIELEREIRYL